MFQIVRYNIIVIYLLLPFIDGILDHVNAIINVRRENLPVTKGVGWALILNLIFGPLVSGKKSSGVYLNHKVFNPDLSCLEFLNLIF